MLKARVIDKNGSYLVVIENEDHAVDIYELSSLENVLEEYEELIWEWACERGLDNVFPITQAYKTIEEANELKEALQEGKIEEALDAIGDVFVTLVIISRLLGYNLIDCVKKAYNEIKNRKGKVINGIFIKEEDLQNQI